MGPVVKRGRLVPEVKTESLETYLPSLTITEPELAGFFRGGGGDPSRMRLSRLCPGQTRQALARRPGSRELSPWTTVFQGLPAACLRSKAAQSDPPETSGQKPSQRRTHTFHHTCGCLRQAAPGSID